MITRPKIWLWISAAVVLLSLATIFVIKPNWGIDFTGGSLLEVTSDHPDSGAVGDELKNKFNLNATVQTTKSNTLLIRTEPLPPERHNEIIKDLEDKQLINAEQSFESIGPTIGAELRRKAWIAIALAIVGMVGYLAYEFRQAAGLIRPWKFGVAAVLAMGHDLIFTTGVFMIFGKIWGAPIDTLFVTALLAILGYSVNDTIIIFNRLKSEWLLSRNRNLITIMDYAVQATLVRSLNTSITTLLVLFILLLFGGDSIRWFVAALTVGIAAGTYSSIFVAPPLLYLLAKQRR